MTKRTVLAMLTVISAVIMFSTSTQAGEITPELRRLIIEAGMAPWSGRPIDLDDTLRGSRREKVTLRQFVGKPTLAYNYGEW